MIRLKLRHPFVPAKAGIQGQKLDSRLRGNEREIGRQDK